MGAPYGQMSTAPFNTADYGDTLSLQSIGVYSYCMITTPVGTLYGPFNIVGGTVTIDRNNTSRRSATNVTLLPWTSPDGTTSLTPVANSSDAIHHGLFSPQGGTMHIFRCISNPIAEIGYCASMGIFLIDEVDVVNDANGVTLVGTMKDRSSLIAGQGFLSTYVSSGTDTADVVIQDILNTQGFLSIPTNFDTPAIYPAKFTCQVGDDIWQIIAEIATAVGYQLFFDYAGYLELKPIPPPGDTDPCNWYLEGTAAAPTTIKRRLSMDSVHNVVRVVSSGSQVASPITVYWWESDTHSPMYYANAPGGGFITPQTTLDAKSFYARFPTRFSRLDTSLLTTAGACQAMANAAGNLALGSLEQTDITIRDNPAQDVDDVVEIQRVVAGIPSGNFYVIDLVVIDLAGRAPQQMTGRLIPNS